MPTGPTPNFADLLLEANGPGGAQYRTKPPSEMIEEFSGSLGQGSFSVGFQEAADAVKREKILPTIRRTQITDLVYIDSYSKLSSSIGLSVQASFSGFTGSGSASYNWSKDVDFERASVYLLLRSRVETMSLRISSPTLTEDARSTLLADPATFLSQFGDQFVSKVTLGGAIYLLVEITTANLREREAASARAEGEIGPVSGSVDFFQRTERVARNSQYGLTVHQVGIEESVPTRRPDETIPDYLGRLFTFLEGFSAKIYSSGGADLYYDFLPYSACSGRTAELPDLREQQTAIRDALRLRDEIISRKIAIEVALAQPELYEGGGAATWLDARNELSGRRQELENFATDLLSDPLGASRVLPFSSSSLPPAPRPKALPPAMLRLTLAGSDIMTQAPPPEISVGNGEWAGFSSPGGVNNYPTITLAAVSASVSAEGLDLGITYKGNTFFPNGAEGPGSREGFREITGRDGSRMATPFNLIGYGAMHAIAFSLVGSDADRFDLAVDAEFLRVTDGASFTYELDHGVDGELLGEAGNGLLALSKLKLSIMPKAY